jgi:hypothetical protein
MSFSDLPTSLNAACRSLVADPVPNHVLPQHDTAPRLNCGRILGAEQLHRDNICDQGKSALVRPPHHDPSGVINIKMIEGLAAIGLAGNIVQFVSFSFALVSKSKEIQQSASGLSNEIVDLNTVSQDIRTFSRGLLVNATSSTRLSDIAKRCDTIAEELLEAISKLQDEKHVPGSGIRPTRWHSFRKALKCVWGKGHIDELKARLELLRDQVTLHLVSDTR